MKTTVSTQSNFCRLTGITEEQYQTALFETGCLYAELYWSKNLPNGWQMFAKVMRETKEYWKWWSTQWNIRTKEAFGIVGINENEKQISIDESDAFVKIYVEGYIANAVSRYGGKESYIIWEEGAAKYSLTIE